MREDLISELRGKPDADCRWAFASGVRNVVAGFVRQ